MSRHAKLVDIVEKNACEILGIHGLKGEWLAVRELKFPHGRGDVILYGLICKSNQKKRYAQCAGIKGT